MVSKLFLGISLVGAEWVLYLLIGLSILSVSLIIERLTFYKKASRGLKEFRGTLRTQISAGKIPDAKQTAQLRLKDLAKLTPDLESEMACALLDHSHASADVLGEIAQDSVVRAKLKWDKNLSLLATIGSNAPFIGLFGTVLGIIQAFHDLASQQAASGGAQTVTAGISEALVATAVGLLVAIPAVVAYNLFQRRVKVALAEAEALKSYLVGQLSHQRESKS